MKSAVLRVARNTLFVLSSTVLIKLFNFTFFLVATRMLAPAFLGDYQLVMTLVFYFTLLGNFGFKPVSVREIARDRENARFILLNILTIRLTFASAGFLLFLAIVPLLGYSSDVTLYLYIMAVGIIVNPVIESMHAMFLAHEQMKGPAVFGSMLSVVITASGIALLLAKGNAALPYIFGITVTATVVLGSGYYRFFKRQFFPLRLMLDRPFAVATLKRTLPFGVLAYLAVLNSRIDILMLSKVTGGAGLDPARLGLAAVPDAMSAVAYYTVPFRIFDAAAMVLESLRMVIFPVVSANFKKSFEVVVEVYHRLLRLTIHFYSVPILFISIFGAHELITIVFSPKWEPSSHVMPIQAVTYAINGLNLAILPILMNSRYILRLGFWGLLALIINVVLNLLLIPLYSFVGAAMATLASVATLMLIKLWILDRTLGPGRSVFPRLKPAFFGAIVVLLGSHQALLAGVRAIGLDGHGFEVLPILVASLGAYCAALIWTGAVDDEEKRQLRTIAKSFLGARNT